MYDVGYAEISSTGPKDVLGNAAYHEPTDGSCTRPLDQGPGASNTFVEATSEAEAVAKCNALNPPTTYSPVAPASLLGFPARTPGPA